MHPNGYPPAANGFQPVHPQQQMMPVYPPQQPMSNHPQVIIPPRPSPQQQYHPNHAQVLQGPPPQQRSSQPQVVIPPRNLSSNVMGQAQNPKIRQVQVPSHKPNSGAPSREGQGHARPPQNENPESKPPQRLQAHQENMPRPQQRNGSLPSSNPSQHRSPLQNQQQGPYQRTPSSQHQSSQHRSSLPQTPSSQNRSHPQVVIPGKSTSVTPSSTPTLVNESLPVDLNVLLLAAADEYIDAARALGSVTAMVQRPADLEQYQKLMATGLGCMEAVLKRYNHAPRDEAKLRLRFASLLVEETDNDVEIEDVITKGIALCSRCRLLDIKYSLQHLSVRYQAQTNLRAAFKTLDGHISEVETFRHIAWVYAFRFLKVSLALQGPGKPEYAPALQQLHAISSHAEREGDRAVYVTSNVLQALIHVKTSSPDRLEHAQRAIASARSLQLQTSVEQLGSIAALVDCVEIACSLQQGTPDKNKVAALQANLNTSLEAKSPYFPILIERSSGGSSTMTTGGIFRKTNDGRDELVFSWLSKDDLTKLAYYLSGVVSLAHDSRGPDYLTEGLKTTQEALQRPSYAPLPLSTCLQRRSWLSTLDWHVSFTLGLVACHTEDMRHTNEAVISLRNRLGQSPFNNGEPYTIMLQYLSGLQDQLRGSFDSALAAWGSPVFALPTAGAHADFKTDLAILATMNRILIVMNPLHPEHYLSDILFAQLEPLCTNHPHLYISTAFKLIRAFTSATKTSINRQKTLVSNAIVSSQKLQQFRNFQFVTMCLNYMAVLFFADGMDTQAVKSVRAARQMANHNRNALWRAVALGLCIPTFQRHGFMQDATACQIELQKLWDYLPDSMKNEIAGYTGFQEANTGNGDFYMQG
ncbi:hypothetical protein BU24DRAFT_423111 [Aaosphaeria arxii CBS 175.79]|uniref:Cohesin loading factor-domain-containing protein n=1 Tax=Aaosphaeria arxii CBS 175.79 TaxID=1450172 RepID=A0A6A5XU76_9PLEO|nr:uncharacterized protein BU24DRAFT_423111 [Aaosphaeria arxii CBS 175.79]KAF2016752.1 hypothetical protein BU24DRAFT_423111 [Aaosphaeria arxii CBS 175.79]